MTLRFGEAKTLHAQHIHPRLLFGPRELEGIRASIRTTRGRKVMAALRAAVGPFTDALLQEQDAVGLLASVSGFGDFRAQTIRMAFDLATVGVLDEDPRTLEAAGRIIRDLPAGFQASKYDSLIHAALTYPLLAYDLLYERLPAEDRRAFSQWVIDTQVRKFIAARRPTYFKNPGMNLTLGRTLPAIKAVLLMRNEDGQGPLEAELAELLTYFEASLNTAICPDGYPEEDTGYGTDFLVFLFRAAEALRRSGDFDAFDRCPQLLRSGRALLSIVEPWGVSLATTGDAGDHFHSRHHLLPRLATLTGDRTLVWLSGVLRRETSAVELAPGQGGFPAVQTPVDAFALVYLEEMAKPQPPAKAKVPTAFHDRRRGLVAYRSGWQPDDTLLVFDGSQRCPAAQGHFHASSGHFSLSALGEYFAIDTGRYNMDQDQHNLVLIDGQSGRPSKGEWRQTTWHGRLTDYQPGPLVDFAAADSSHQHNCFWAFRSVGLVKGRGLPAYAWVVDDLNKANDWAEYWWTLNTCPENTIRCLKRSASIRGCQQGNYLDVHFALPPAGSYPRPHTLEITQDEALCGSHTYVNARAAAARIQPPREQVHHSVYVRPRLIAKVAGYNGRFLSLLLPRRKGAKPAKVEQLKAIDNALAVRITHPAAEGRPAVEDTLVWAYDHRLLEAGDISGRGTWCLVRRDPATGRVLDHAMGEGTRLEVAGQRIV